MRSDVPWQVTGVRRLARDTAREAARRSGISVGEWLDSVILDSALHEGIDPKGRLYPSFDRHDPFADQGPGRNAVTAGAEDVRPRQRVSAVQDDHRARTPDDDRAPPSDLDGYYGPVGHAGSSVHPRDDDHELALDADDRDQWRSDRGVRRRASELAENSPLAPAEYCDGPAVDQGFAEVKDRLDTLTRQLSQLAQAHAASVQTSRSELGDEGPPRQLIDIISRLDQRLDQLVAEERAAMTEMEQRVNAVDRAVADLGRESSRLPLASEPPTPLDQALIEIADRQRTLDGYAPVASEQVRLPAASPADSLPRARTQELSGLEQQLREINTRIETLGQPCGIDKAVDTLRNDLAEIGLMLQEAMPRKAVEALEIEVRKLAERVDQTRHAGADGGELSGVERGLAEVRDALRALTPAESLIGIDHAVRELSQKVEFIANNAQDSAALEQLEGAIVTMRGIASHVASNDALGKLADEVRALATKVEQAAVIGSTGNISTLENRIAMLADALEARNQGSQNIPGELESAVKGLIDKIEQIQLSRADQAALGHLEDRIARLVEKLDASDARLNHLEAIERGLAELLIHLEHQRLPNLTRAANSAAPETDGLSRDVAELRETESKTPVSLELVHSTLGHMVERLAMIETDIPGKPVPAHDATPTIEAPETSSPAPVTADPAQPAVGQVVAEPPGKTAPPASPYAPPAETLQPIELATLQPVELSAPLAPKAAPAAPERRPIDPDLPPDHPLEPGSGLARGRNGGSPADRIAASEAALSGAKPPVSPDPAGTSNFIAAARRAAQAAGRDAPARKNASAPNEIASPAGKRASPVGNLRKLIAAAAAVLIALAALHLAWNFFNSSDEAGLPASSEANQAAATATTTPPSDPAAPVPPPATAPEPAAPPPPPAAPAGGRQSSILPAIDGTTIATPAPGIVTQPEIARQESTGSSAQARGSAPRTEREATGSVSQPGKPAKPAAPAPAPAATLTPSVSPVSAADRLPAGFGSALRAAAAKGDAAAQFEVASRFAEGRGVPQNMNEAAEWFERAAKQGLAPAQFRLGGLYEKGLGVKKNLEAARRFYLAAGEAGNAKALHNLAVLHAEGVDGKPDYQTAARWFRKAADYGIADSQYNLGILYARGIGVEQNLAEAYKWFALAARQGDAESLKKRDEVGARLDQRSLMAAKQAEQAWTAEQQPDAAVQIKTPPGGWDGGSAASTPAPAKRKPATAAPKLDLSTPRARQNGPAQ